MRFSVESFPCHLVVGTDASVGGLSYTENLELLLSVASVAVMMTKGAPKGEPRHPTLKTIRERVGLGVQELNTLVPYPRLTDRPADLWAGADAYLQGLRAPLHPAALPNGLETLTLTSRWL